MEWVHRLVVIFFMVCLCNDWLRNSLTILDKINSFEDLNIISFSKKIGWVRAEETLY